MHFIGNEEVVGSNPTEGTNLRKIMKRLLIIIILLVSTGCASIGASKEEIMAYDGRYNSWFLFHKNPCLLGGVDEESNRHCNEEQWGIYGKLIAINEKIARERLPGENCSDHADALTKELQQTTTYRFAHHYSCPTRKPACHVAVVVKTYEGDYVLDNGGIITSSVGVSGVAPLEVYESVLYD